jgi:hypothetical protein
MLHYSYFIGPPNGPLCEGNSREPREKRVRMVWKREKGEREIAKLQIPNNFVLSVSGLGVSVFWFLFQIMIPSRQGDKSGAKEDALCSEMRSLRDRIGLSKILTQNESIVCNCLENS